MVGRLLFHLIPLLAPFALYGAYLWWVKRMQAGHPGWREAPWAWLTIAGFLLAAASFVVYGLITGEPVGGIYEPAHVEDGKLVPGRIRR